MMAEARPRRLALPRKLALAASSVVLALLVLEAVVRIVGGVDAYGYPDGMFVSDPHTGYRFKPGYGPRSLVKQEFTGAVFTNSQGFRDRERGPKPEGGFRVLSLGDSFVWGAYGTSVDETYGALLERMLGEVAPGRAVEVINAGVMGWGTDNELAFYEAYGREYGADVVLLSFCVANDFFDNMATGELSVRDGNLVETASFEGEPSLAERTRRFLLRHSRLYVMAERGVSRIPAVQRFLQERAMRQGELLVFDSDLMSRLSEVDGAAGSDLADKTRDLILELKREVEADGARLVLFPVPAQYQVNARFRLRVAEAYGIDPERLDAPQRYLAALCREHGLACIDPLERFRARATGTRLYWELNPHLNKEGNREAARALFEGLRGMVEESRKGAAAAP